MVYWQGWDHMGTWLGFHAIYLVLIEEVKSFGGSPAEAVWGAPRGAQGCSGQGHSQAVGCPRQHLHSLVQHLKTHFPVIPVSVAVEQQSIECSAECEVILSAWGKEEMGSQAGWADCSFPTDLVPLTPHPLLPHNHVIVLHSYIGI